MELHLHLLKLADHYKLGMARMRQCEMRECECELGIINDDDFILNTKFPTVRQRKDVKGFSHRHIVIALNDTLSSFKIYLITIVSNISSDFCYTAACYILTMDGLRSCSLLLQFCYPLFFMSTRYTYHSNVMRAYWVRHGSILFVMFPSKPVL